MNNFERHFGSVADTADFLARLVMTFCPFPDCALCPVYDTCHADDDDGKGCDDIIAEWLMQEVEE